MREAAERGGTHKAALALLSRDERKRLGNYAARHGVAVSEVLDRLAQGVLSQGELAEAIFTDAGRQSDGEKHFHNALVKAVNEQVALLDPNGSFVRKLPGGFLNNGPTGSYWKGLDFHVSSYGIHELTSHKYTNGSGGSQTNSNHELQRLVSAATPYNPELELEGDWPQHHYPEPVECISAANWPSSPGEMSTGLSWRRSRMAWDGPRISSSCGNWPGRACTRAAPWWCSPATGTSISWPGRCFTI